VDEPGTSGAAGGTTGGGSGGPPGERRLDRPPSERYVEGPEAPAPDADGGPSAARGLTFGIVTAVAGGLAITLAGGILAITAGLLVIAATLGYVVPIALALGNSPRNGRVPLGVALAVAGVAIGQLGLWLVARREGGTLGLVDYLDETFGYLVPIQFALAAAAAWWRAR
jgi:hypothetical protein